MFITLLFIAAVVVAFVLWSRDKAQPNDTTKPQSPESMNQQWMDYLYDYRAKAHTKSSREFFDAMLADLTSQGMPLPSTRDTYEADDADSFDESEMSEQSESVELTTPEYAASSQTVVEKRQMQLDNTTILLYFGAFLFVSAVGLFVGFGTSNGFVRLAAVLTTLVVFYAGGLWVYEHKPKLKIAGLTFVGIGLVLAPLAGVAAYSYILSDKPQLVWLLTSIVCMALYAHALYRLRHPLLEYLFIGTLVSLFESSVAVYSAPVYWYGWALVAVGILLQAVSYWRKWQFDMDRPSTASSQLLVPAALVLGLYYTVDHGALQLAVTSLLASAFYVMDALRLRGEQRQLYAGISHVLLLVSVGAATYSANQSLVQVGLGLVVASVLQAGVIVWQSGSSAIAKDFATVTQLSLVLAVILLTSHGSYATISLVWFSVVSFIIWVKQQRPEGFTLGLVAIAMAPIAYSYLVLNEPLSATSLASIELVLLYVATISIHMLRGKSSHMPDWFGAAEAGYAYMLAVTMLFVLWAGGFTAVGLALAAAITTLYMAERHQADAWSLVGGLAVMSPVLVTYDAPGAFMTAISVSLVWNVLLALRYRRDANRWLGSISWFLLPVAVQQLFAFQNDNLFYALAYVGVTAGFILARVIAVGRVFQSAKVPIVSYMRTASMSYVVGYLLAAAVAIVSALLAGQYSIAYVSGILVVFAYLLAARVEKQPAIIAAIPLLLQIGLWGSYQNEAQFTLYALGSALLAFGGYMLAPYQFEAGQMRPSARAAFGIASLAATFVTPFTVLLHGDATPVMTLSLVLAGIALLYAVLNREQPLRELAGGIVALGILWLFAALGITNIQAYTHVVGATAIIYAVWRNALGDAEGRQAYTITALLVTSVPLLAAALNGDGGGLYGWWFLLEQIGIMLVGFSLTDKLVIRWGLYASMLAVLYQLRSLGWVALAVLALFIIGVAVFRLQRLDQNEPHDEADNKKE